MGLKRGGFIARAQPLVARVPLKSDPSKPLKRTKGLTPGAPPARTEPAGDRAKTPQQARREIQLATWADVLEVMYPRDDYRCAGCGTTEGLNGHHREPKQMGSTKTLDLVENALTLCQWKCHPWAHRYRNSAAIARGFCVPKGADHAEWPVIWFDGSKWLLTADGERVPA